MSLLQPIKDALRAFVADYRDAYAPIVLPEDYEHSIWAVRGLDGPQFYEEDPDIEGAGQIPVSPSGALKFPYRVVGFSTFFGVRLICNKWYQGVSIVQTYISTLIWALMFAIGDVFIQRVSNLHQAVLWVVALAVYLKLLTLAVMKMSNLTGWHASEHMTIHCIERGLKPTIENVRKMPRIHRDCGTNTMVSIIIGVAVFPLFSKIGWTSHDSPMATDLMLLFGCFAFGRYVSRWIGPVIQYVLVTREPSTDQIVKTIGLAYDLWDQVASEIDVAKALDFDKKPWIIRFPIRYTQMIWVYGMPWSALAVMTAVWITNYFH
jgi:hypothetical protein